LSSTNWIELLIAAVALVVLSVSAWVEISLTGVSRIDIRRLLNDRFSREDAQLIERNQRLRSSMLLVELLAAAVVVAMIVVALYDADSSYSVLYGLLIGLGLVILFGRLLPRMFAADDPGGEPVGPLRAGQVLSFLCAPIIRPVEWLAALLAPRRRRREEPLSADEVTAELSGNGANGDHDRREPHAIEEDEQDMITGVLHLEQATARQIMVPRIDIVAVAKDVLVSEAVDVAIQAGHSRIPVFGRNIDEVLGVVYAKDLLKYVNEEHEGVTVEPLIRPAYFVPESKRVDDLLSELQQAKVHLAVVVDEFGGTAGVVTIEDILEEIVGEIQDEYDREMPQFDATGDDEAIADGRLSIDDLCDEMDLDWPDAPSGTLGGYIQRRLGRIPAEGETVRVDGIRLSVLKVEHRRVRQVRVERLRDRLPTEPSSAAPGDASAVHQH
jgi:CBS domain containing-hemolysin-like protein